MQTEHDIHRPLYVPDLLVNALSQNPDRPMLHLENGPVLTVGEVRNAASQYCQVLESLGLGKGSRVGLISANRPEVLHLVNAVQLLAATYVPMHPLGGLEDHRYVLEDSGVDVLIYDAEYHRERALALAEGRSDLRLLAIGGDGEHPDLAELAADFSVKPLVAPEVGDNDVMRLGYSGGTTGKPKALASVQRTGFQTVMIMMAEWEWPAEPRFLSCTPLSHAGAAMFLPLLLKGGTMRVLPAFDPEKVLAAIEEHKINCLMLVPAMIYAILDHPKFDQYDLSSLETVFYGASSISPPRLKEAIERIGPVFMQFYGQAEAPMAVTILRKAEHDTNDMLRLASCGRPTPWVQVSLRDAENKEVPEGEPGEICVRGPLVMNGYRDNPELTAEAFEGGWLHSGDVAVRDRDGFLRIIDRTKDMIVSGGFNIFPREVEDIIAAHPAVAQVAVIGVPHPKWGEAVTALIVCRDGKTVTLDDIAEPVAAAKGRFQAPKFLDVIDSIPLTPVGKPDKKVLRERYKNFYQQQENG